MAIDKAVDSGALDAGLKAIADTIRTKSGASGLLLFPDGFNAAISSIQGDSNNGIKILPQNLHDSSADIANVYLHDGVEEAYSGWSATGYIPISAATTYAIVQDAADRYSGNYCSLYDNKKAHLNILGNGVSGPSALSSFILMKFGVDGYVRFSGPNNATTSLKIYACSGTIDTSGLTT